MVVKAALTIYRCDCDAAIFDLDGVLTDTACIHAAAWKTVFDAFLRKPAEGDGGAVPTVRHRRRLSSLTSMVDHATTAIRNFLAPRNIVVPGRIGR